MKALRILAALAAAVVLGSCSDKGSSDEGGVGLAVVDNGGASYSTNVKSCSYPAFLDSIDNTDTLSNISYRSFDAGLISDVKSQPFEGYDCITSYPGLYIYRQDNFVGLLDSDGNVILPADTFARAELVSPTLVKMYLYDFDDEYVFADISNKAEPEIIESFPFKSSNIRTVERRQEESDRVLIYLEANGAAVGQTGYDSVSQKDISELPKSLECKKAYTVTKDGAYYIIAFDKYYNYTVYEGTYSRIDLNIAGKPGSCYIMSYEDTNEAKTLIDSFTKYENTVAEENEGDYISFDFGLYGEDDYFVTVYSTGAYIAQGRKNGVQFYESAGVDARCFADLVRWTESVVSKEYVTET